MELTGKNMDELQSTPRANRLHIGIFGRTNSGKSSLLNSILRQDYAVVSDKAGTTTDPVYKSMEINGIGPVTFIDTAGFSDSTELREARLKKTELVFEKTDVAVILFTRDGAGDFFSAEKNWISKLRERKTPFIPVLNKTDVYSGKVTSAEGENTKGKTQNSPDSLEEMVGLIEKISGEKPVMASALRNEGIDGILENVKRKMPENFNSRLLTSGICGEGDLVLLVMPQDIQAPKGRLILPQVQLIRELLDKRAIVQCCVTASLEKALASMSRPPDLIITDSQVFKTVYDSKPPQSKLTSFSVLLAANKGEIDGFVSGAESIGKLSGDSRVLIAEACTHAPLTEDIGREKIPNMLRRMVEEKKEGDGSRIQIDVVSGTDFPKDLSPYSLIIHCGACMFNRSYVISRQEAARLANVPMTNYGITLAYLSGILDKITIPE